MKQWKHFAVSMGLVYKCKEEDLFKLKDKGKNRFKLNFKNIWGIFLILGVNLMEQLHKKKNKN